MSTELDVRIREYLDRVQPGWSTSGILGGALDAVLTTCSAIERNGGNQVAITDIRSRVANELGVRVTAAAVSPMPQPCNYCSDPILWATTPAGARMPIDAVAHPDGNVLLQGRHAGVLGVSKAAAARAAGQLLHRHHATTCPYSSRWKGGAR